MGKIEDGEKYLSRLNGKIFLVAGNHDVKALKRDWFVNRFEWVKDCHEIPVQLPNLKLNITLSLKHYPWHYNEETGEIDEEVPPLTFRCHGHQHGAYPFDPKKPQLDVGVDGVAQYLPLPLEKVLDYAEQFFLTSQSEKENK